MKSFIRLQERGCGKPGENSRVYQMSVPAWVPRMFGWNKGDVLEVSSLKEGMAVRLRKAPVKGK
jgi:hypothetical protein